MASPFLCVDVERESNKRKFKYWGATVDDTVWFCITGIWGDSDYKSGTLLNKTFMPSIVFLYEFSYFHNYYIYYIHYNHIYLP